MRQEIKLTELEKARFWRLPPRPGAALRFWKEVALARGLDPDTVLGYGSKATALPLGHGKHWCYPALLKCRNTAQEILANLEPHHNKKQLVRVTVPA